MNEPKICKNCREEISGKDINGYCSEKCEAMSKKSKFTTMSIRHEIKNRLTLLQNEIIMSVNKKVPLSDLIEHVLDIAETEIAVKGDSLAEEIINDGQYYL